MKVYILQTEWLNLPQETRQTLVYQFAIHKSEGVVVQNNKIMSDGCSQRDLMGLTIDKMIDFLGNEWEKTDNDKLYDDLFIRVLNKINGKTKDTEGIDSGEEGSSESAEAESVSQADKPSPSTDESGRSGEQTVDSSNGDRRNIQPKKNGNKGEGVKAKNAR